MPIDLPSCCPRGRTDCEALAQIVSDCETSFICCGLNDGTTRVVDQDMFTFCFKNDETDEMTHNDKQDLKDMLSVIAQGLSVQHYMENDGGKQRTHEFRKRS